MEDFINIGYIKEDKDMAVLMVSRKTKNNIIEIINAFYDEEAEKLYNKLTNLSKV